LARDVAAAASLARSRSVFNETDFGAIDVDVVRLES